MYDTKHLKIKTCIYKCKMLLAKKCCGICTSCEGFITYNLPKKSVNKQKTTDRGRPNNDVDSIYYDYAKIFREKSSDCKMWLGRYTMPF